MSTEINFSGLDKQFLDLEKVTISGIRKASRAGAEIVAAKLKQNTPFEDASDRKWKAQRHLERKTGQSREFKHLRDDIEISRADDLGEYTVHYGEDTAWRSRFVNDGTINQPAQHFAERTENEARGEVQEAMQAIIAKELRGL